MSGGGFCQWVGLLHTISPADPKKIIKNLNCPKREANELPMATDGFRVQLDQWNLVQTHQVSRSEQLCVYAWMPYQASFCPKREASELPMATDRFRVQLYLRNLVQTHQVGRSEQLCFYVWRPYRASFCPKREVNELPMAMEGFRVQLDPWNLVQTHQVGHSEQLCVYAWRPYRASFCPKQAPVQLFPVPGPQGEVGAERHLAYDDPRGVYCLPSEFHLPSFHRLGGVRALQTDRQTDRQTWTFPYAREVGIPCNFYTLSPAPLRSAGDNNLRIHLHKAYGIGAEKHFFLKKYSST